MRFAALILAAGESRRMGPRNKLLLPLKGRPLAAHVLDAVLASDVSDVCIVLGHDAAALRTALEPHAYETVHFAINPAYRNGMASSLICGLASLGQRDGVLVCLGDMPGVPPDLMNALCAAYRLGDYAVVPVWKGQWGNPVLLSAQAAADARTLTGDRGARALLKFNVRAVREVAASTDAVLHDIDHPKDWSALQAPAGGHA